MSGGVYSDIRVWISFSECGNLQVIVVDRNGSVYNPNLILPNLNLGNI